MPELLPTATRALSAIALVAAIGATASGCGGSNDSSSTPPTKAAAPTTPAAPSTTNTVDPGLTETEAQAVGLDVADYAVKHDFTDPASQQEFAAKVKFAKDLHPGSKAGYEVVGAKHFRVCVTDYSAGKPAAWAIYDSVSGAAHGAAGTPTNKLCPGVS